LPLLGGGLLIVMLPALPAEEISSAPQPASAIATAPVIAHCKVLIESLPDDTLEETISRTCASQLFSPGNLGSVSYGLTSDV